MKDLVRGPARASTARPCPLWGWGWVWNAGGGGATGWFGTLLGPEGSAVWLVGSRPPSAPVRVSVRVVVGGFVV
jgi:hypothetical protein